MNLAKGRNGRIGRQVPGQGLQAKIVQPSGGGYNRNLYLSEGQIAADQNYFAAQEAKNKALGRAREAQARQAAGQAQMQMKRNMMGVAAFQQLARVNPMNARLLQHFARQKGMGASSNQVASTLYHTPVVNNTTGATSGYHAKPRPPADFSNSGANMHLVPDDRGRDPVVWHSDYRMQLFKGNPLTRDGVYGPKVTDYDRFVNGVDVNESVVAGAEMPIAGNTMLGRYEGKSRRLGGYLGRAMGNGNMGDDTVPYDPSMDTVPADPNATVDLNPPAPYDPTLDPNSSYWTDTTGTAAFDTGNVAPTEEELAAATPAAPGVFDKIWTAAEVQADKTLPLLLQQQMLQAISSGAKVGSKGGTVVIAHPGGAPVAIGTISTVSKTVIYAALGLAALGIAMMVMKKQRTA